jgi:hypothetical protein
MVKNKKKERFFHRCEDGTINPSVAHGIYKGSYKARLSGVTTGINRRKCRKCKKTFIVRYSDNEERVYG